ncbi:N-acetylmuramic acid 6-phosphate etherase [Paenarthrobacter nitroguajacolicus]|uniref:N-acetylmuramic acid 6-phosphate etherase n=1 Tax=Paenarthrobacter nitroguajacolicus TaxID=211146 RepID=UPI00248BD9F4|nr:N-acetylmuramic acid 6-phosphate etherase [Paenarthrobacter nitroguajacolicus]MDI2033397.1 N-acetylmuramic acid 6-phosphate etherase [Paenarthrobacter nitroguajacolicus]
MTAKPHARPENPAWLDISTEARSDRTLDLDQLPTVKILEALNDEDQRAPAAVRLTLPVMAQLVEAAEESIRGGGRVHYFGAGTSGRLGVLDAAELRPTFNLPEGVVVAHHAGGSRALTHAVENVEDSWDAGVAEARDTRPGDVVIGIAASGRTPYVGGALTAGREQGATTALISCAKEPELGHLADFLLVADTGAEALAGSTRLKAGTAQKLMLNGFSTTLMIKLGKTWSNLMVSVVATNEKLRARTVRILMEATGGAEAGCLSALEAAEGDLKVALAIMFTGAEPEVARGAVQAAGGDLRRATESLRQN